MPVTTEEEPSRPAKAQEQEHNQGGLQKTTLSGGQPCRRRSELPVRSLLGSRELRLAMQWAEGVALELSWKDHLQE